MVVISAGHEWYNALLFGAERRSEMLIMILP